jgi:hypothetical protein
MSEETNCQTCPSCVPGWAGGEPGGKHPATRNLPRRWSAISYPGETLTPAGIDPAAGSWPLYFLNRDHDGRFFSLKGTPVNFKIQQPENFDFYQELMVVKQTLQNLTPHQKEIAKYWGFGPPSKQWTPIIDRLIDTYGITPNRAARVLASVQAGVSDALVITWYYKYLWDVPRPVQLDRGLSTVLPTPRFPTYPAGHSTFAGAAESILSYFFPPEAQRLHELAEECSISRLYAGIHFPCDDSEGLRLGRQIGQIAVDILSSQGQDSHNLVDLPITLNRNAVLPPPPHKQIIPYPPQD